MCPLVRIIKISFCSSEGGSPCGHCVKIGRAAGKLVGPHSWVAGQQGPFFNIWGSDDRDEDGGVRLSRDKAMMSAYSVYLLFLAKEKYKLTLK